MVSFKTSNIVGSGAQKTWSQAQTIAYADDDQLMVVIKISVEDEESLLDLVTVGSEILSEVELKGRGCKSQGELKILYKEICDGLDNDLKIELLFGRLVGLELALYGDGEVESFLARNGQLARLGNKLSGNLQSDDVVVLATARFGQLVGVEKLKRILIEENSPAELITPIIHSRGENSGVAAIVGEFVEEKKPFFWPKIHLKPEQAPRKLNLVIGISIFFLLIIMIGVGMVRRVKIVEEKDFNAVSSSVAAKLNETVSVGDLNPERARSLLGEARSEVETYLSTKIKDEYKLKGQAMLSEIDVAEEKAFKKNDIKLNTVVELPILAEGLNSIKMKSDSKENLIFLDSNVSRVVSMNLNDRSRQIVDATKQNKFVDFGMTETKIYGLNSEGLYELNWKNDATKKTIEPDEFWKEPRLVEMFAGNAYILDREQGEIWKYPTLGDQFGGRRRWFAVGITPDLTNVVDMKIVGDGWLLTSTGKIERYNRGAPAPFTMEGFPAKGESKKLSEPSSMWVTDSLVYVLENGASRVVVFGIDGKYQSQYANSEFAKASNLVIVDDKAYVLIGNVVKEFGL